MPATLFEYNNMMLYNLDILFLHTITQQEFSCDKPVHEKVTFHKTLKNSHTWKNYGNSPKIWTTWCYHIVMRSSCRWNCKQCWPWSFRSSLIWVYTVWTASSEFGTYHLCEQRRFRRTCASAHLARTSAARSYKQWVKRNLQTESQIPGPSEWLGMRS